MSRSEWAALPVVFVGATDQYVVYSDCIKHYDTRPKNAGLVCEYWPITSDEWQRGRVWRWS